MAHAPPPLELRPHSVHVRPAVHHCKTDATRCRALPIARRTPLGGCSRTSPRVHRSRAGLRRHLLAPNHAYFSHPRPATLTRSTGHPRPATFTRPSTQRRDELTHPQLLATLGYANAPVPALVPDCGGGYSAACPTLTASKMECRRCLLLRRLPVPEGAGCGQSCSTCSAC